MKHLITLLAVPLLFLLPRPESHAQTRCPAGDIKECPPEGCGGWDRQLNYKKNLTDDPDHGRPEPYTLEQIRRLEYPRGWFSGKDRHELAGLKEGKKVVVKGYLIHTQEGEPDFANCLLTGPENTVIRLALVSEEGLNMPQPQRTLTSVTAVLTPRVRAAHGKWTKAHLDGFIYQFRKSFRSRGFLAGGLPVRVTGLLLLDTEHIYGRLERSTDWEVHPVLKLEVCLKVGGCPDEKDWTDFDTITSFPTIKRKTQSRPPAPNRHGTRIRPDRRYRTDNAGRGGVGGAEGMHRIRITPRMRRGRRVH